MSTNLAQQLRERTTKSHSMAENVSFVKSFLGGLVDKHSYRKLVANLYFIYDVMEEKIEQHKSNFAVKAIYFPQLYRKSSLEQDLRYYYGVNWLEEIKPSPATQFYVNRIRQISYTSPELLIAHSYTRYIGDLSGGQMLKKIAKNAMQLPDNHGTSFYDFELIEDEKNFKDIYRESLNNIPLTKKQIDHIILETNTAFNLNMKIFQELNFNIIKIMIMILLSSISNLRKKFA